MRKSRYSAGENKDKEERMQGRRGWVKNRIVYGRWCSRIEEWIFGKNGSLSGDLSGMEEIPGISTKLLAICSPIRYNKYVQKKKVF